MQIAVVPLATLHFPAPPLHSRTPSLAGSRQRALGGLLRKKQPDAFFPRMLNVCALHFPKGLATCVHSSYTRISKTLKMARWGRKVKSTPAFPTGEWCEWVSEKSPGTGARQRGSLLKVPGGSDPDRGRDKGNSPISALSGSAKGLQACGGGRQRPLTFQKGEPREQRDLISAPWLLVSMQLWDHQGCQDSSCLLHLGPTAPVHSEASSLPEHGHPRVGYFHPVSTPLCFPNIDW